MTQFNKGPAYGLSAEVKSKVSIFFSFCKIVNAKAFWTTVFIFIYIFYIYISSLGLEGLPKLNHMSVIMNAGFMRPPNGQQTTLFSWTFADHFIAVGLHRPRLAILFFMHVQHFIIFNVIACEVSILSLGAELLRSVVGFYCALNAKVYAFFSFFCIPLYGCITLLEEKYHGNT